MGPRALQTIAALAGLALAPLACVGEREPPVAGSPCGPVERQPRELGLERTRALTLCLLNAERAKRGLAGLAREPRLEQASQGHSRDMVERRFFEHDAPGGIEPYERMLAAGYPSNNASTAENIAWGTGTRGSPGGIVEAWMRSPPHREAILESRYTVVGVGVAAGAPEATEATDPPATYTTDFGGPPG